MTFFEFILFTHAAVTGVMAGLIWFVQVVHYPLIARVDVASFVEYEKAHVRRTTWIVSPAMLVEAVTASVLPFLPIAPPGRALAWAGLLLLLVVWVSTVFFQVPCHSALERGFNPGVLRRLVVTNWARTTAWSIRFLLALALLGAGTTSGT